MKRLVIICFVLLFAKSAIAEALPKELKPRYDGVLKAITKLDGKAYRTFFADTFFQIDAGGTTVKRSDAMKQADSIFKTCKSAKCEFKCTKSTTQGDTIAVNFDFKLNAVLTTGKSSSIHEIGTDTWKKIKGVWLIIKTVDTTMDIK